MSSLFLLASKRKYNLKTHMGTHDKEKSKRFRCDICHSRLSRKHDLKRHRDAMHGEHKSSLSVHSSTAATLGAPTGFPVGFSAYFRGV